MVQAFSSDRADEAFDVTILPRGPRRRRSVADAHGCQTSRYGVTARGVSVPDEVSRRLLPGEGLGDLAGDPVGRGVGRNVGPYQVASLKPDDHQAVEQLEADRRHDEQVDSANMRDVIVQ